MGRLSDFLAGRKILGEVYSPINGKLTVIRDLAWGTHVVAGGITQSGGVLKTIWYSTIRKIDCRRLPINHCLILGLGGGSAAKLVRKFWPEAKITGVDLDPVMVGLGREYLGLDESGVEVIVGDAFEKVQRFLQEKKKFDLIFVDLYVGSEFPKKFEGFEFIKNVEKLLGKNGLVVVNRLYYKEKKELATKFQEKLEKVFRKVEVFFPEANVMFICFPSPATI